MQNTQRNILLREDPEAYSRDNLGMSNPVVALHMATWASTHSMTSVTIIN